MVWRTSISLVAVALHVAGCGGDDGSASSETTDATTGPSTESGSGSATDTTSASTTSSGTEGSGGTDGTDGGSTGGTGGGDDPDPVPPDLTGCDGGPTGQEIMIQPGDDYISQIQSMQPGDVMRFAAGTYDGGLPITDLVGEAGGCFYFEGPAAGDRARFTGSSARNTVSLRDSGYVVIRNLELDGIGELGDAVKAEGNATFTHHVVLENLFIHGHGADQQIVGISTKCPSWSWVVRSNWIEGAGTGLYLGNSDGSAPFVAGLIEHNVVVDTLGYNMEIKHQNPRPMLDGLPTDPRETIIRHNVFSKENGSNGGDLARPNLLVGHWPLSGPGQDDRYLIYGNFLYHNAVDALLQAEGNVAVYDNIFVNPVGSAVHIQPHNDVPKAVDIFFNTVMAMGNGIRVTGGDPGFVQAVRGNAVFAGTPLSGGTLADNTQGAPSDAPAVLVAPDAAPGAGLDVHPQAGGLDGPVDTSDFAGFMRWDRDFDGRTRDGSVRGAYAGPAGPGAWPLALDRKP